MKDPDDVVMTAIALLLVLALISFVVKITLAL